METNNSAYSYGTDNWNQDSNDPSQDYPPYSYGYENNCNYGSDYGSGYGANSSGYDDYSSSPESFSSDENNSNYYSTNPSEVVINYYDMRGSDIGGVAHNVQGNQQNIQPYFNS